MEPFRRSSLDPLADREARASRRHQLQRLGIGVEDRADRFRHARGFGRGDWIGDRALHQFVHMFEVGGHEFVGERCIGAAPFGLQPHGHFNEQQPRRLHPELFRAAAIMRYQCLGNRREFSLARRVVEQRPLRTARIHRIEDDVARGVVECFDKRARQIEHDAAHVAFAGLFKEIAKDHRLAGTSRTDQHRMALLQSERVGDTADGIGRVNARSGQGILSTGKAPAWPKRRRMTVVMLERGCERRSAAAGREAGQAAHRADGGTVWSGRRTSWRTRRTGQEAAR